MTRGMSLPHPRPPILHLYTSSSRQFLSTLQPSNPLHIMLLLVFLFLWQLICLCSQFVLSSFNYQLDSLKKSGSHSWDDSQECVDSGLSGGWAASSSVHPEISIYPHPTSRLWFELFRQKCLSFIIIPS